MFFAMYFAMYFAMFIVTRVAMGFGTLISSIPCRDCSSAGLEPVEDRNRTPTLN